MPQVLWKLHTTHRVKGMVQYCKHRNVMTLESAISSVSPLKSLSLHAHKIQAIGYKRSRFIQSVLTKVWSLTWKCYAIVVANIHHIHCTNGHRQNVTVMVHTSAATASVIIRTSGKNVNVHRKYLVGSVSLCQLLQNVVIHFFFSKTVWRFTM